MADHIDVTEAQAARVAEALGTKRYVPIGAPNGRGYKFDAPPVSITIEPYRREVNVRGFAHPLDLHPVCSMSIDDAADIARRFKAAAEAFEQGAPDDNGWTGDAVSMRREGAFASATVIRVGGPMPWRWHVWPRLDHPGAPKRPLGLGGACADREAAKYIAMSVLRDLSEGARP